MSSCGDASFIAARVRVTTFLRDYFFDSVNSVNGGNRFATGTHTHTNIHEHTNTLNTRFSQCSCTSLLRMKGGRR